MPQRYTKNDMIRFLYQETSFEETKDIHLLMEENKEFREKLEALRSSVNVLSRICRHREPHESSLKIIRARAEQRRRVATVF